MSNLPGLLEARELLYMAEGRDIGLRKIDAAIAAARQSEEERIHRLLGVTAMSSIIDDYGLQKRALRLHFDHEVTDKDRENILASINLWQSSVPLPTTKGLPARVSEIEALRSENALLKAAHGKSARARRRIRRVNKFDGDKAAIVLARKLEGLKAENAALRAQPEAGTCANKTPEQIISTIFNEEYPAWRNREARKGDGLEFRTNRENTFKAGIAAAVGALGAIRALTTPAKGGAR